eukprot:15205109-Heterocapsa_arctica.AAC.1
MACRSCYQLHPLLTQSQKGKGNKEMGENTPKPARACKSDVQRGHRAPGIQSGNGKAADGRESTIVAGRPTGSVLLSSGRRSKRSERRRMEA